jgi:hypothetical protein
VARIDIDIASSQIFHHGDPNVDDTTLSLDN